MIEHKVPAAHLERTAYVYVRRSTADQLAEQSGEPKTASSAFDPRPEASAGRTSLSSMMTLRRSAEGMMGPGVDRLLSAVCS